MKAEPNTLWRFKGLEEPDTLFEVVSANEFRVLVRVFGTDEDPTDWDIADFEENFEENK